jgi:son of sevenless-like protein
VLLILTIPFFVSGVYLSSLTFIEQGNADFLPNGQIHFFKCRLMAEVLKEIQQYQQSPYKFEKIQATSSPEIQEFYSQLTAFVMAQHGLTEDEEFKLSLIIEPREPEK